MHAGKRRTLQATIVTIFSHMTRDVSTILDCFLEITTIWYFLLLQGNAATNWTYGDKYYMTFVGNLLGFPAVKEFWQEALLSQRGRAMLRVCIASIQNVECSLLLFRLQIYHWVQLNSFMLSSLRRIVHATGRHKQTFDGTSPNVHAIYTAWSSVTVFVTS